MIRRFNVNRKKHKLKPGDTFKPIDNTILDCPNAVYDYNWKTYLKSKRNAIIISIIALVLLFALLIFFKNIAIVQTVISVIIGGFVSIIVWVLNMNHKDEMEFQIENLNYHIDTVNRYIEQLNTPIKFISPDEIPIYNDKNQSEYFMFLHFLQLCTTIQSENIIDCSQLYLMDGNNKKVLFYDWIIDIDNKLSKHMSIALTQELFVKMKEYNMYIMNTSLEQLKQKLQRYKYYTYSQKPPVSYKKKIVYPWNCKIMKSIKQYCNSIKKSRKRKVEYRQFAKELMNISKNTEFDNAIKQTFTILDKYKDNAYNFAKSYIENKELGKQQLFAIIPRFESVLIAILCSFAYDTIKGDIKAGLCQLAIVLPISFLLSVIVTNINNKHNQVKFFKNSSGRYVILALQHYCDEYESKIINQ